MNYNPNFAEMFRNRPMRFVLPLIDPKKCRPRTNLVNIPNHVAKAYNVDGNISVFPELLSDVGCETPRINSVRYSGKEYRYFYAICADVDSEFPGKVLNESVLFGEKSYSNCFS